LVGKEEVNGAWEEMNETQQVMQDMHGAQCMSKEKLKVRI